jgi:hypothetical protein
MRALGRVGGDGTARAPARWRDDPLGRPPAAEALLRGARLRAVAPVDRARLGMRLEAVYLDAAAGPGVWRVGSGGVAAVAALAALVASPLTPRLGSTHTGEPTASAAALSTVRAAPAAVAAALPAPTSVAEPPLPPPAPPIQRERTARDALDRETRLVDGALENLSSAPVRALALLERHRRAFPRGQLSAEREYLAVEVLCRLDRLPAARRRARALAAAFPDSSYAARAHRAVAHDVTD